MTVFIYHTKKHVSAIDVVTMRVNRPAAKRYRPCLTSLYPCRKLVPQEFANWSTQLLYSPR